MNPIWQVYLHGNAMSDKNTPEPTKRNRKKREAQREKVRQEKEHRRAEAVERDRQRYMVDHEGDHEGDKDAEEPSNEESAAERFQKELCWCIQQLEKGLLNLKPTAKQGEEAKKLLRTLKSPRAPMAKKRQVMRMTFGDYRTKMQREEKTNAAVMKKTVLAPATLAIMDKGTFFRKSTTTAPGSQSRLTSGSELDTVLEADSSEESITSLEKHANEMTLSDASHEQELLDNMDEEKEDVFVVDNEEMPHLHDMKHCNASCSRADHDNLSLRSSPSGASTSSSTSHPAVLLVNQYQNDSKQSPDSYDKDSSPITNETKSSFCFNFAIEQEDIDHGPPPKKRPVGSGTGRGGKTGAKPSKEDSASSEGSPKIGELEKKVSKKGGGRRRKSKKKQERVEVVNQEKQDAIIVDNNQSQIEKQELSSVDSGDLTFAFNFPDPS